MIRQFLKSKIHRAKVTEANLDYIGSVTIDEDLMDAAKLTENEQVHVFNYSNDARIITYVIKGERGSGIICLNGPAANQFKVDDQVIIVAYCGLNNDEVESFKPAIVFPDTATNKIRK